MLGTVFFFLSLFFGTMGEERGYVLHSSALKVPTGYRGDYLAFAEKQDPE